jgi:hypothetical protein
MITQDKDDTILGVTIIYNHKVYKLPCPNRHHNVIHMIAKENGVGIKGTDEQGFYSVRYDFISREAAMQIATVNGQLKARKPGQYAGDELFSEDLW